MQVLTLERKTVIREICLVLLASFAICLFGQLAIPLWFTPIPIGTQNAAVLLIAVLLGAKRGMAATFAFLVQGALGLPVFANGGAGLATLLGPKGGYLIGYLIASFITGYITEKKRTIPNALTALAVGNFIIYLCGTSYLSLFVGWDKVFFLGVAPFLLGDACKIIASLKILQWIGWSQKKA